MSVPGSDVLNFVRESNRIEGIVREPNAAEVSAHIALWGCSSLDRDVVELFVAMIGGGDLRDMPGMNVYVGNHVPPKGGQHIVDQLDAILDDVNADRLDPWVLHVQYETLHPFMDGNGRSGRAIWAWQVLHHDRYPHGLHMGFLHPAYYAALDERR